MGTVPAIADGDKRGREEFDLQAEIDERFPAPQGRCDRCGVKLVRRRDDPMDQGAVSLPCWSWGCLVCRAKKVRRLAEKFSNKTLYGDGMPFVRPYQASEWGAVSKKLRRTGCVGLRVETDAEGNGTIVGLAPMPEEGMVPMADRVEAVLQLLDALEYMCAQLVAGELTGKGESGRLQPLAGIGGWKLSHKDDLAEESELEVVGKLSRKFREAEAVEAHLKEKGIESKRKTNVGRSNWFVRWRSAGNPFAPDVSESCSLTAVVLKSQIRTQWNTPAVPPVCQVPGSLGAAGVADRGKAWSRMSVQPA